VGFFYCLAHIRHRQPTSGVSREWWGCGWDRKCCDFKHLREV